MNISVVLIENDSEVSVFEGNEENYIIQGRADFSILLDKKFVELI